MTDLKIFMDAPQNASEQGLKSYLDEDAPLRAKVEALFRADKAAAAGIHETPRGGTWFSWKGIA